MKDLIRKRRVIQITDSDLDGVGSYIITKKCIGFIERVIFSGPTKVNDDIKKLLGEDIHNLTLIITDLSVNEEVANLLAHHTSKDIDPMMVILLDHHESALWLNRFKFATVNVYMNDDTRKTSGAQLAFDTFSPLLIEDGITSEDWRYMNLKTFANQVRKYDVWEWKSLGEEAPADLNRLYSVFGRERFIETMFERFDEDHRLWYTFITVGDDFILDLKKEETERYCESRYKQIKITNFFIGYKTGLVIAEKDASALGEYILSRMPELDILMIVNFGRDAIELRTVKPEINLSPIAKANGGGGHAGAAGFPIPKTFITEYFTYEKKDA